MKVSAKNKDFEICPKYIGRGVIVDVTPPVPVETQFGKKDKFRVVVEIDKTTGEGKDARRHCVWSAPFTPSLSDRAAFREFLTELFGRSLTAQELEEFDTENLIGHPCFIVVKHEEVDGKTFANIATCIPHDPATGEALKPSGKFIRKKDREDKKAAGSAGAGGSGGDSSYRRSETPAEDGTRDDWMKVSVVVGKHKDKGVSIGDLDPDAIKALVNNWLPKTKLPEAKITADEKRMAAALEQAMKVLTEAENAAKAKAEAEAKAKAAAATPPPEENY